MSDQTSACIEFVRSLDFSSKDIVTIGCPKCEEELGIEIESLSPYSIYFDSRRSEVEDFLQSHHPGHGKLFLRKDDEEWTIPLEEKKEPPEPQAIEPTIETKTQEEPPSKTNPEPHEREGVDSDPDISEGDPFEDETWIKLYRKFIKNPIFKDSPSVHLWVYLLLKANHKPNRFLFNKKEITVKRGQLISGRKQISKETGISEWKVRERLKALEGLGMTASKTTNKFRVITICNYNEYQDSISGEPPAKPPSKIVSKPPSTHHQPTTNKNVKNKELNKGRASQKPDADPRVSEFKNWWGEFLLQKKGVPYHFDHAKDGAIAKRLLSTFTLPDLKQYAQDFLDGDDQGERQGYTVGVFSQAVNRIAQKKAADPVEQIKRRERLKREREVRAS